MTSGKLLMATRGQWKRAESGKVVCPIEGCGKVVSWPDWARMGHLKVHCKPPQVGQPLPRLDAAPERM